MRPSLIFDKSALQQLKADEAMWLDNFYIANITPLFFVETLADLEKEVGTGRTPEQVVGIIADKTPETGCANAHHENLLYGELTGQGNVQMGRPIIPGGQVVRLGDETGVIFREPPEIEAFQRWQKHQFLEVERTIAKEWRRKLACINPIDKRVFQHYIDILGAPKSFEELKAHVDRIINGPQRETLIFGLLLIGVSIGEHEIILRRWEESGRKPIREFAPYFTHVLSVDLFFHLGTVANLFTNLPHAQTHMVDLAYLYYLPFCDIFISNDKFHIGIAPWFLRPDQTFVSGDEMKTDLAKLDQHYSQYPEEVKNRGVITFASVPPHDTSFLVTRLWDKYMSSTWRNFSARKFDGTDKINSETDAAIIEKISKFANEAAPIDPDTIESSDEVASMMTKRTVSNVKGKWRRFPPEVVNSPKRIFDKN